MRFLKFSCVFVVASVVVVVVSGEVETPAEDVPGIYERQESTQSLLKGIRDRLSIGTQNVIKGVEHFVVGVLGAIDNVNLGVQIEEAFKATPTSEGDTTTPDYEEEETTTKRTTRRTRTTATTLETEEPETRAPTTRRFRTTRKPIIYKLRASPKPSNAIETSEIQKEAPQVPYLPGFPIIQPLQPGQPGYKEGITQYQIIIPGYQPVPGQLPSVPANLPIAPGSPVSQIFTSSQGQVLSGASQNAAVANGVTHIGVVPINSINTNVAQASAVPSGGIPVVVSNNGINTNVAQASAVPSGGIPVVVSNNDINTNVAQASAVPSGGIPVVASNNGINTNVGQISALPSVVGQGSVAQIDSSNPLVAPALPSGGIPVATSINGIKTNVAQASALPSGAIIPVATSINGINTNVAQASALPSGGIPVVTAINGINTNIAHASALQNIVSPAGVAPINAINTNLVQANPIPPVAVNPPSQVIVVSQSVPVTTSTTRQPISKLEKYSLSRKPYNRATLKPKPVLLGTIKNPSFTSKYQNSVKPVKPILPTYNQNPPLPPQGLIPNIPEGNVVPITEEAGQEVNTTVDPESTEEGTTEEPEETDHIEPDDFFGSPFARQVQSN